MNDIVQFPRQALPLSKKNGAWGEKCLLWGNSRTPEHFSPVRNSIRHKRINYDLMAGKLHMDDLATIINPAGVIADYIPKTIQHFPIMNSKLQVLIGEELKRPFDWRAIVTNMSAVSDIERVKKEQVLGSLREIIEDTSLSMEDYEERLEDLNDKYTYNYQDFREVRANEFIRHYSKAYNMPLIFNDGYIDALAVGEEAYDLDIIGGEPTITRVDQTTMSAFRMGRSNKFEDADIILFVEYWNPGRIIDTWGDQLTKKDIEYLDNLPDYLAGGTNQMGFADPRQAFVRSDMMQDEYPTYNATEVFGPVGFDDYNYSPYDSDGNVRVMRMRWKSLRKIQKVKKYDPETGEEYFMFYGENYVPDKNLGETSETLWVNQAWEGALIGGASRDFDAHSHDGTYGIFIKPKPRLVQYNSVQDPSRCHLGVVGSIYNFHHDKPFSMVDMMKPYNYLYDVIHNRLEDALASSWGAIAELDLALIPENWTVDKWMYFMKVNHIAVRDSFNEGQRGASLNKLAGSMNNNTQRIIADASGNYIQQLMNLAEWVKTEMGEIVGINRQREGQIANRETVGGVERATLQSSYITERYFAIHNDIKRRALDAFIENGKVAAKGRKFVFEYILSDTSRQLLEIDGDEFAENSYGIVVDSSSDILNLDQKLESLAQAALQTQQASLSDVMQMWINTSSVSEKIRILQNAEKRRQRQAQQTQQMEMQAKQEQAEAQIQAKQMELETQVAMNSEDNETKVLVAQIQADSKLEATYAQKDTNGDGIATPMGEGERAKLNEQIREFNLKLQQDSKKLDIERQKLGLEAERNDIARIAAKRKPSTSSKK